MEIIIAIAALLASLLTLISGFGLGTILTPVFILFFPVEVAIALTGIVHLLNNVFKIGLLYTYVDRKTLLWFGVPGILGAFFGAKLLLRLEDLSVIHSWSYGEHIYLITPIKLVVAVLMIFFAITELVPTIKTFSFKKKYLLPGGAISGFFGGLSGHQGALRTMFLIKAGLTKEMFIATGVAIAVLVDFTRLPVYFARMTSTGITDNWQPLVIATASAFIGAYIGKKVMHKITIRTVQIVVGIMMIALAILLGIGII